MPDWSTPAVLAFPFVLYGLLALPRRARYRALAARLRARHVDAGWFRPGRIAGDGFEVDATPVGRSYRTRVQVAVGASPNRFYFKREFFGETPDWSCVRVPEPGTERVFLWELSVERHVPLDDEQRRSLLAWLPPGALSAETREALAAAKIREIVVADGWAATRFGGILSSRARLERALAALRRLVPERHAAARSA